MRNKKTFFAPKLSIIASLVGSLILAGCNGGGGDGGAEQPSSTTATNTANGSNNGSSTPITPATGSSNTATTGSWAARQFLSNTGWYGHAPQAVVDTSGNVTVAWTECDTSTNCALRGKQFNNAASRWSDTLKIDQGYDSSGWSTNNQYRGNRRYLAISDNGTIVAAFGSSSGRIAASIINSSTGSFTGIIAPAAQDLSECRKPDSPAVAIDSSGTYAIVTWRSILMGTDNICAGVLDISTQKWKSIQQINTVNRGFGDHPNVVTSGMGQGYVAWIASTGKVIATRYDGNAWLPEQIVSSTSKVSGQIALMPFKGKVYAAWGGGGAGSTIRFNTFDPNTNKWGTEAKMTEPTYVAGSTDDVSFVVRNNSLTASWVYNAPPYIGYYATLQADNTWKQITGPSVWNFILSLGVLDSGEKVAFTQPFGYLSFNKMNADGVWPQWKNIGDNAVSKDNAYAYSNDGKTMAMVWVGNESNNAGGVFANIYR